MAVAHMELAYDDIGPVVVNWSRNSLTREVVVSKVATPSGKELDLPEHVLDRLADDIAEDN